MELGSLTLTSSFFQVNKTVKKAFFTSLQAFVSSADNFLEKVIFLQEHSFRNTI